MTDTVRGRASKISIRRWLPFVGGLLVVVLLVPVMRSCSAKPAMSELDMPAFAVRSGGAVWSLGHDCDGQLGNGSAPTADDCDGPIVLSKVVGLDDVVAVRPYGRSVFAVTGDGDVWAWGDNTDGRLGDGTTSTRGFPVRLDGLSRVVDVATGGGYAYAIRADGTVWRWPTADDADPGETHSPTRLEGITGVTAVAPVRGSSPTGFWALRADGTVTSAGEVCQGREGPGTLDGLADVVQVATWSYGGMALRRDGTVWAWNQCHQNGKDGVAQVLGLADVVNIDGNVILKGDGIVHILQTDDVVDRWDSSQVQGLVDVVSTSGEWDDRYALCRDGSVWSWSPDQDQPRVRNVLPGLPPAVQVAAGAGAVFVIEGDDIPRSGSTPTGHAHPAAPGTLAILNPDSGSVVPAGVDGAVSLVGSPQAGYVVRDDGAVLAWGENGRGQLGNGTTDDGSHPNPMPVEGLQGIVSIATFVMTTYAVDVDGNVWGWGEGAEVCADRTQLINGPLRPTRVPGIDDVTKVVAAFSGYALRQDGSVWTWGYGCSTPTIIDGLTDVVDIAVSMNDVVAVRSDGTVWIWNDDDSSGRSFPPAQVPAISGARVLVGECDGWWFVAKDDHTVWALAKPAESDLWETSGSVDHLAAFRMEGLTDVLKIVEDTSRSFLALREDGSLWTFKEPGATFLVAGQMTETSIRGLEGAGVGPVVGPLPPVTDLMVHDQSVYVITNR